MIDILKWVYGKETVYILARRWKSMQDFDIKNVSICLFILVKFDSYYLLHYIGQF